MRSLPALLLLTCTSPFLTGCPAALSQMSGGQVPALAAANAAGTRPQASSSPFSLQARNAGGFVEFTLQNNSPIETTVRPEEFALLIRGTRQQVHYDPRQVVIDLPPGGRVAPGQSITGRARYFAFPDASGHRMVYNPGADPRGQQAVFADIRSGAPNGNGAGTTVAAANSPAARADR